ncbi:putative sialic acid transporter [Metallosphaera sp. J1]|uniref:MFS transporter n=1 Tax=Metallosphaera javensis (ex Hofmann et al. 2022) TaxID=99938 RepID=UPI001EDF5991|nr:MFS transporter [Metallosphaera javensis (ex Hofmann et al. 2022)]MCG3110160.1 putative sialic acid transporter [Metallosphaera javensis (ex Hofmann et al. 2022)]
MSNENGSPIGEIEPFKSLNNARYTPFHRNLTIIAALGAFTDLYTIQVLGASTFSIVPYLFHGKTTEFALAASLLFIGAVIGTLTVGLITDFLGRRLTFILDLMAVVILAIISAFVTSPVQLYIVRFLLGVATGGDYPAAMTLVAEFMPKTHRGRALSYLWTSFTLGGVLAYVLGYLLYISIGPTPIEWRIMLGSVAVPALIGLALRTTIPESPRWLIMKGKFEQANDAIKKATGTSFNIEELAKVRDLLYMEKKVSYEKINMSKIALYITPIVIAAFCFNLIPGALSTLNPTILSALGIVKAGTLLYSAFFLGVQTISTYIVAIGVEKIKRVNFALIGGILEMIFSFLVVIIYHNPILLLIAFTVISYGAFTVVPVIRNFGSEIFPTKVRGTTSGIVMTGDRLASAIGLYITPLLFSGHNVIRLFSVYGILGIIGVLVLLPLYSRLKIEKMGLEEIQDKLK